MCYRENVGSDESFAGLNGYQLRRSPNPKQEQILRQWIGCPRVIYNAKVQEERSVRRVHAQMVGTVGMKVPVGQQYSRFLTARTACVQQLPSQILRNGAGKFRQT